MTVGANQNMLARNVQGGTSFCCHMIKARRLMYLGKSHTQLVEGWCFRKLQPLKKHNKTIWISHAGFIPVMMQEARLRLYISALRGFPFCLSVSQYHGDRVLTTQQRHCTSLYNIKLLVSSVFGYSFTSRWPGFVRFTWR